MHASTAWYSFESLGDNCFLNQDRLKTWLVLCPRLTFVCFAVCCCAKHVRPTYQLSYVKQPVCVPRKHTQHDLLSRGRGYTFLAQKVLTGRAPHARNSWLYDNFTSTRVLGLPGVVNWSGCANEFIQSHASGELLSSSRQEVRNILLHPYSYRCGRTLC